jgi:hypothetical protein
MGKLDSYTGIWLVKSEGKRSLERPRRRWEDNIKIDRREVECGRMGWIEVAQDREWWRTLGQTYATAVFTLRNIPEILSNV